MKEGIKKQEMFLVLLLLSLKKLMDSIPLQQLFPTQEQ